MDSLGLLSLIGRNEGITTPGVLSNLVKALLVNQTFVTSVVAFFTVYVVLSLLSPGVDRNEPPLLKPTIPFIGHFIDIFRKQTLFLPSLRKYSMPIATLPILSGKSYAIWDPELIQAVHRSKNFSFSPLLIAQAKGALGLDDKTHQIISNKELMQEYYDAIHKAMVSSEIQRMSTNALKHLTADMEKLNKPDGTVIPNLWYWLREIMTICTCKALYGPENPIDTPELVDDIWVWDDYIMLLTINKWPSWTAKDGYLARNRLASVLNAYYSKKGDNHNGAANIVKWRAAVFRKYGIEDGNIGTLEIGLLHVATINTIPVLFWFVAYIITRPDVLRKIRSEAELVPVYSTDGTATIDMHLLVEKCPLLLSAYRETLRLCDSAQGARKVLADTSISDTKGHSYLLKEGFTVQMPCEHLHKMESVWGAEPGEFHADRFLKDENVNPESARRRRISFYPFGGGRHYCPGRNFATAENMGFFVSLILSYEMMPLDGNWETFKEPKMDKPPMTTPIGKPVDYGEGFGMKIKRRPGWENVKWEMITSKPIVI